MSIRLYNDIDILGNNRAKVKMVITTEVAKERFLALYSQTCHVTKTCTLLGLHPRTLSHWKRNDANFKAKYEELDELILIALEDEALRRAYFGVQKPIYQGGRLAGYVTEYSDTLMAMLLKAKAPGKYRETTRTELTGPDGRPLVPDNRMVHINSDIPLSTGEEQIDPARTLQLPASSIRDYNELAPIPVPITNTSNPVEEQALDDLI